MTDKQAVLAAVKTALGAKIKAGMLYVGFSADKGNAQYTEGAIWAFEAMLAHLDDLNLEALPIKKVAGGTNATERANALWQGDPSS